MEPPPQAAPDDRIRAAMVGALYEAVFVGVTAAAIAACLLAAGMARQGAVSPGAAASWAACVAAAATMHIALAVWRRRSVGADVSWRLWQRRFAALALLEGCLWGWGSVSLAGPETHELQYLVMVVTCAIAIGAVPAFSSDMPTFLALFLPAMAPFMIRAFNDPVLRGQGAAVLTLTFALAFPALALRSNRALRTQFQLRFEREALMEQLAYEKAAADRANTAKSQFLAAASHDLRQPVHALSMFVGALRGRTMDSEAHRLVGQVDETIAALDGLFGALLDLSRLDAGATHVQSTAFAIDPLLDRVCRQWRPEAEPKGLALRRCRSGLFVDADPILLERVLQNLVANAVRHTPAGRVLVGCRAGRRVRIEVWDTGPGISQADQARVFEEYVQVGNPERDRRKGLGLGLAIVRRIVALMGAELTLRSRPGHGSCFAVSVNRADWAPQPPGQTIAATVRARGLILLIDDEVLVRDATSALLAQWGHQVVAAASLDDMLRQVAGLPQRPALMICDYRLGGGENGIETIHALQSEFNDDVPALLVTGDTAPDRLLEAQRSGLPLLHKPVTERALRDALAAALA